MPRHTAITCAVCGVTKGETNHWLVVDDSSRTEFLLFCAEVVPPDVAERQKDVCGASCSVKLLSRWNARKLVTCAGGGR